MLPVLLGPVEGPEVEYVAGATILSPAERPGVWSLAGATIPYSVAGTTGSCGRTRPGVGFAAGTSWPCECVCFYSVATHDWSSKFRR